MTIRVGAWMEDQVQLLAEWIERGGVEIQVQGSLQDPFSHLNSSKLAFLLIIPISYLSTGIVYFSSTFRLCIYVTAKTLHFFGVPDSRLEILQGA